MVCYLEVHNYIKNVFISNNINVLTVSFPSWGRQLCCFAVIVLDNIVTCNMRFQVGHIFYQTVHSDCLLCSLLHTKAPEVSVAPPSSIRSCVCLHLGMCKIQ